MLLRRPRPGSGRGSSSSITAFGRHALYAIEANPRSAALVDIRVQRSALRPGFFDVVGTVIGVVFVSVAVSGLTLSGARSWVSSIINGAALLVAVGLSHYLGRSRGIRAT